MRYLFAAITIWALAVPAALAQSGIGYVDVDRVFSQMPEARTIQSEVDAEFRAEMQSIEALEQEIRDLIQRKTRDSVTMSATDLRGLDNAIAKKRADYQESFNGLQNRMQSRLLEKRNAIRSRIVSTTDQVRGERGLAMIIDSENVLSASSDADLTNVVLERLTSAMASRPAADNQIYDFVEQMPVFSKANESGTKAMTRFIAANTRYPQAARASGVEGMVVVSMIVERDGTLSDVKVVRSVGAGTDEEALRVAKMLTFQPGLVQGTPVRTRMNIPIKFKLN